MDNSRYQEVRAFHRTALTGVMIVTSMRGDEPVGLTLNAMSSVSLDPPVILVCLARTTATHEVLFASDALAVNVMASDQAAVAAAFARSSGVGKFDGVAWRPGACGAPLIDGATATLEAEVETRLQAYTHTIFVARVTAADVSDRPPLAYMGGRFYDPSGLVEIAA